MQRRPKKRSRSMFTVNVWSWSSRGRRAAALILGALLPQGDDGVARSILTDVGAADPSLEVRGFARTF